jgi:hypothetical protein
MSHEPAQIEAAHFFRSIESLILAVFGTLWILFAIQLLNDYWLWLVFAALAAIFTIVPAALSVRRVHRRRQAEPTISLERDRRIFALIHIVQGVLIIFAIWYFPHTGRDLWTIPAIILILGLHLLPIAKLTKFPTFYVLGVILILLALLGARLVPGLQSDGYKGLAAGFLLWIGSFLVFTRIN